MANKIRSKDLTIGCLFDKNYFKLLKSQREYKWGEEQIIIFLNDLMESFIKYKYSKSNKNDDEFETLIGCFYTINNLSDTYKDKKILSIIDGQQRILSLLILLKFIIEKKLSPKKDEYKKYYFEKIRNSNDRSELENNLYQQIFSYDNNYENLINSSGEFKDMRIIQNMKIISDYFLNKTKNKYDTFESNDYKIFFEFITNIKVINISIDDSKLAFDTFIKLNARGIELTDLELLHSYIWTLEGTNENVAQRHILEFSENYNKTNDLFEKEKPYKSKTNYFHDAFYSAYHCFAKDINVEYDNKNFFKKISKSIEEKPEKIISDINDNWFKYCENFHDMIVNIKNPYYKLCQILKKIKRTEYIPLLAMDLFLNSNLDNKYNNEFMEFCKIVSIVSYVTHIYNNEINDTSSKFDSENLLFDSVLEFLKSNCENKQKIKELVKLFPDETLYNNKNKILDILKNKLSKILSNEELEQIYLDMNTVKNKLIS